MEANWLLFELVIGAALLGLIPAMIADKKGHRLILWSLFGAALFIIALPASLLVEDKNTKKCPQCTERVKLDALRCRFCGHEFHSPAARTAGLIKCPHCHLDIPATLARCTFCRHALKAA